MTQIMNAIIKSTMLGIEGYGIMTFSLNLSYGWTGQSAGGYSLMSGEPKNDKSAYGIAIISEILRVVGVEKWEDLKGKHIRVKASHDKVMAIGNIIENIWLDFDEFCQKFKADNQQ